MEARAGIEPAIEVLQTPALPLGYLAELFLIRNRGLKRRRANSWDAQIRPPRLFQNFWIYRYVGSCFSLACWHCWSSRSWPSASVFFFCHSFNLFRRKYLSRHFFQGANLIRNAFYSRHKHSILNEIVASPWKKLWKKCWRCDFGMYHIFIAGKTRHNKNPNPNPNPKTDEKHHT